MTPSDTSASPIRAVLFDFGGVVAPFPTEGQWEEAAAYAGIETQRLKTLFWKTRLEYDRGGDPVAYWSEIGRAAGVRFDHVRIAGLIEREIAFWSRFDARVLAWAGDLRAAGFRTGILSNLPRPLGESLRRLEGFLSHFDHVTFSYEIGAVKPQPEIYRHAIAGLGLAPAEILFIDDRPENIEGGEAAGLATVTFTTWEDFLARDRASHGLPEPQSRSLS